MNKEKLRSIMILNKDNQNTLSAYIGVTPQCFSSKINGRNGAEFTQSEINEIKKKYNLSPQDVDDIFFAQQVS